MNDNVVQNIVNDIMNDSFASRLTYIFFLRGQKNFDKIHFIISFLTEIFNFAILVVNNISVNF